ncbi:MAG TPA: DUF6531 domain-containing protein [Phnomibacter sp.]|nr:DUF6531 domain-containing protein [Phnomibacter sp.]
MNSGEFYIGYTDIEFKAFSIDRSYNSKSSFSGLFGFGWSSLFNTRLVELPDGTVNIHLYGDGSLQEFSLPQVNKAGIHQMVESIIAVEINSGKIYNTPVSILARKQELLTDKNLRNKSYQRYMEQGKIAYASRTSKTFTRWFSFMKEELSWNGKVYVYRNYDDTYMFNDAGKLMQYTDGTTQLQLDYGKKNISGFRVGDGPYCTVKSDTSGRIIQMSFEDSGRVKQALFQYDNKENLVYSRDVANNEYWYQYDKSHNMVRINYFDSTSLTMEYDPLTFWATRVTDRKGNATTYQYHAYYREDGTVDDLHYGTTLHDYDSTGKMVFTETLDTERKMQTADESYLYRYVHKTDTSYTENIYPPFIGNVVYRKSNEKEAWSSYDGKQRPVYLRLPDSVFIMKYNEQDLPEKFWAIDSLRKDTTTYTYAYNKEGELARVEKNGKKYTLTGSVQKGKVLVAGSAGAPLTIWFKDEKPIAVANGASEKLELPFSKTLTNKAALLKAQYEAIEDICAPKEIMHNWIWEKL